MAKPTFADIAPQRQTSHVRVAIASSVGTALEWYDFFIYGTASALVFNELFFPELDPWSGTLAAFTTFGLGFIARPFGGLVFGHFGDRVGPKRVLATTLLTVGAATFLIGCIPTYAQIGALATALLDTSRPIRSPGNRPAIAIDIAAPINVAAILYSAFDSAAPRVGCARTATVTAADDAPLSSSRKAA